MTKEFAGNATAPADAKIEYTVLPNGVTVVSENSNIPGPVHFKILLNVGTRNENNETSGSLHSIKNTYLKTVVNTNETVNYGMVQMSGGYSSMKYDQETAVFSAGCIAHDAVDIFGMIADCALEPRSIVSANVSMHKSKQNFKLEKSVGTGLDFNDALFRTAYGGKGLGNPILGLESNIDYLTAMRIQRFQLENITPQRIFIGGANVENHSEFVDLVAQKLSFIAPLEGRQTKDTEASEYIGGSFIQSDGSNDTRIGLLYEAPSWKSADAIAVRVAAQILGNFTDGYTGILGATPYTRSYRDLLSSKAYIHHAGALNFTFSDSGLFGIGLTGSGSHASQLLEDGQTQLRRLAEDITDEDVALAKAALRIRVLRGIETPVDRLDETLRNFKVNSNLMIRSTEVPSTRNTRSGSAK